MNVIKYKEKIRDILPKSIFNLLIFLWRKSYVKIYEFYRRKKLNNFTHSFFKEIFANIWMYTNFFPQIVSQNWKVIAFEPVISNYEQNLESITKNKYSNVVVHNFALSDKESEIDIFISDKNLWGSSFNKNSLHTRKEKIKTYTGDSILLQEKRIDFIKIDTEWSELQVLKWLEKTLKKHSPKIIIEFSPVLFKDKKDAKKILDIFQNIYDFVYIIEYEKTLHIKNTRDYKEFLRLVEVEQVNLFFYNKK